MPFIEYVPKRFRAASLALIDVANGIIDEYRAQGFDLTLRQLYYQMVSRGIIPNNQKQYDNLGKLISDARLAGLIDWSAIVDRTRNLRRLSSWSNPAGVIDSARHSFHLDRWANQAYRLEVWIEKDALTGVIEGVCNRLDIPYFAARGYSSQSEMWGAAQRLKLMQEGEGKTPVILYLGDHDPSGIDMSRDVEDRLMLFMDDRRSEQRCIIERLALNWDQVQQYNPPPNPTKLTDSRATGYIADFGLECWELDALEPTVIGNLITTAAQSYIDRARWVEVERMEREGKKLLADAVKHWPVIASKLAAKAYES